MLGQELSIPPTHEELCRVEDEINGLRVARTVSHLREYLEELDVFCDALSPTYPYEYRILSSLIAQGYREV